MVKMKLTDEELNMILSKRNKKAQDESAANASSNDGANNVIKVEIVKPKRAYKPSNMSIVLRGARKTYAKQVDKCVKNKIMCLEGALAGHSDIYPDKLRFALEFKAQRDRLLDSTRFNDACKAMGLVPEYVADHVVFEGIRVVEMVLKEGLQVVGEKVHMFNAPLWEDTEKLYNKTENQQVEAPDEKNAETKNEEGADE